MTIAYHPSGQRDTPGRQWVAQEHVAGRLTPDGVCVLVVADSHADAMQKVNFAMEQQSAKTPEHRSRLEAVVITEVHEIGGDALDAFEDQWLITGLDDDSGGNA